MGGVPRYEARKGGGEGKYNSKCCPNHYLFSSPSLLISNADTLNCWLDMTKFQLRFNSILWLINRRSSVNTRHPLKPSWRTKPKKFSNIVISSSFDFNLYYNKCYWNDSKFNLSTSSNHSNFLLRILDKSPVGPPHRSGRSNSLLINARAIM